MIGARGATPALLTRPSMRPKRASVRSTIWATWASSVTSVGRASASPPWASISSATCVQAVCRAGDEGHARAVARKGEGDAPPDALAGAGDDDHLIV